MSTVAGVPDIVRVHVTADLPIRARALPFADRVEIRFGKAFPVVLVIDRAALGSLGESIQKGQDELDAAAARKAEG